jgi:four helix bundle protein
MDASVIKSHKDLVVWQKGFALVKEIYQATSVFPDTERYGLISQIRRCAVSIPANIAEGRGRFSKKEFAHFVSIAYGSASELDTLLLLAKELGYIPASLAENLLKEIDEISRMLNKLRVSLQN